MAYPWDEVRDAVCTLEVAAARAFRVANHDARTGEERSIYYRGLRLAISAWRDGRNAGVRGEIAEHGDLHRLGVVAGCASILWRDLSHRLRDRTVRGSFRRATQRALRLNQRISAMRRLGAYVRPRPDFVEFDPAKHKAQIAGGEFARHLFAGMLGGP